MSSAGRPLRFVALVLGGWVTVRVALLWPHPAPSITMPFVPPAAAEPRVTRMVSIPVPAAVAPGRVLVTRMVPAPRPVTGTPSAPPQVAAAPPRRAVAVLAPTLPPPAQEYPATIRYSAPEPQPPRASRWSGSGWAIVRAGTQRASIATPQLGGSQAGARIAYALDADGRFAIAARVAAALGVRQQEAAIGVEWKPAALPLRLIAERRIAIVNSRSGFALGVAGGVSGRPVAHGARLDGYAQAGVIARDGTEGYADGALRLSRPVGPRIDAGVGAWGAAQRGAARLDVGPSLGVALPVGRSTIRTSLDWRQRVAGSARPGSGLALSIGSDW